MGGVAAKERVIPKLAATWNNCSLQRTPLTIAVCCGWLLLLLQRAVDIETFGGLGGVRHFHHRGRGRGRGGGGGRGGYGRQGGGFYNNPQGGGRGPRQ